MASSFSCVLVLAVVLALATGMPVSEKGFPDEIKKLVEEAITDIIDKIIPNNVTIMEPHNLSKAIKVPLIGEVSADLAFNNTEGAPVGAEVNNLDSATVSFGNFTDTQVNVTLTIKQTAIVSNTSGQICVASDCHDMRDLLTMVLPIVMEASVSYKLKTVFGVPVGLDGTPCFGPVLNSSLGEATVSGFGGLDKYLAKLVNLGIKEQHLFRDPLDKAINEALHALQPKCNFTAVEALARRKCMHHVTGNQCLEACAHEAFSMAGVDQKGRCDHSVFNVHGKTESSVVCSKPGVNIKYCHGGGMHGIPVKAITWGKA